METFVDNTGRQIHVGDVLIYDEGPGYGQCIEEVIEHDGELATLMRVGEPKWTVLNNQEPMPLKFYKAFPESPENVTTHATVVDVAHAEAFTPEYADIAFYTYAKPGTGTAGLVDGLVSRFDSGPKPRIEQPMSLHEIAELIKSNDYNPEFLVQHLRVRIPQLLSYIDYLHGEGNNTPEHIYSGHCPPSHYPGQRDEDCPACVWLGNVIG